MCVIYTQSAPILFNVAMTCMLSQTYMRIYIYIYIYIIYYTLHI